MSEKEEKMPKGLEELGKVFTFDFDIIKDFVNKSSIDELKEILKEDIQVAGFMMMLPKNRQIILLMSIPKKEGQTMLVASKETDAEKFYKALSSFKKR